MLIVYLIVNQIEGNLILPLIMARTVAMHPSVVSLGLLVMAALFGLIGVLIAIPLLSLAAILAQALWIEPREARADRKRSAAVTATAGAMTREPSVRAGSYISTVAGRARSDRHHPPAALCFTTAA